MDNPEELVPCILEVVAALESRGEKPLASRLSEELGRPWDEVEEAMGIALERGFLERDGSLVRLTEKGQSEVLRHRELYVHDKYAHPSTPLGRVLRFFDGTVKDWRLHWRHRHGLDEKTLKSLYDGLGSLQGRIENAVPLVQLSEGRRGVVVFTLGGRGVVQRLAEMGLTPGTEVTVVREAPFHGPVEVRVRGVSLALGHGIASKVFVKPLERG